MNSLSTFKARIKRAFEETFSESGTSFAVDLERGPRSSYDFLVDPFFYHIALPLPFTPSTPTVTPTSSKASLPLGAVTSSPRSTVPSYLTDYRSRKNTAGSFYSAFNISNSTTVIEVDCDDDEALPTATPAAAAIRATSERPATNPKYFEYGVQADRHSEYPRAKKYGPVGGVVDQTQNSASTSEVGSEEDVPAIMVTSPTLQSLFNLATAVPDVDGQRSLRVPSTHASSSPHAFYPNGARNTRRRASNSIFAMHNLANFPLPASHLDWIVPTLDGRNGMHGVHQAYSNSMDAPDPLKVSSQGSSVRPDHIGEVQEEFPIPFWLDANRQMREPRPRPSTATKYVKKVVKSCRIKRKLTRPKVPTNISPPLPGSVCIYNGAAKRI